MRPERSLRRRIVSAHVLLAFVACTAFAIASYFMVEAIEQMLINDRLSVFGAQLVTNHRRGLPTDQLPALPLLRDDAIPAEFRHLPPGVHDLEHPDGPVHVWIGHDGGQRFALIEKEDEFNRLELEIFVAVGIGLAACLVLSLALGWATARQVVAPVTALAEAVQRDMPPQDLPSIDAPDEVGMLARAFAARTNELQRLLARERMFTGDVSHELRTPLTVILGAAELLRSRPNDRADDQAVIDRIERTARDSAQRLTALLLLARAPTALDAPPTPLTPLLQEEIERCRPLLAGKPVTVRLDAPADRSVFARPELASIAIGNLLRNACQSTEQGEVVVRLAGDEVSVEDTGPGLPPAVRARLFQRNAQVDGGSGSGAGLGLSIVKRVVERLAWSLRHEDRPGGGSRFVIGLPPQAAAG